MGIRKDYLQRLIEQLAEALARILQARQERRLEDAAHLIRQASREVLGMEYGALVLADAGSTARLLGELGRVHALARLVLQEAALLRAQGTPPGSEDRERLALELYEEALRRGLKPDEESTRELEALRATRAPGG